MKMPISKYRVFGNSMLPTLSAGQDIVSFNWAYISRKPRVGEIIVLNYQGNDLVKRVTKIEDDQIYVEGDNPEFSTDSRHFGAIDVNQVIGKVVYQGNIPCPRCEYPVKEIYGRKDAICQNCGFKLSCCGEP